MDGESVGRRISSAAHRYVMANERADKPRETIDREFETLWDARIAMYDDYIDKSPDEFNELYGWAADAGDEEIVARLLGKARVI